MSSNKLMIPDFIFHEQEKPETYYIKSIVGKNLTLTTGTWDAQNKILFIKISLVIPNQ